MDDTIYAPSSAIGGAIAIIRVSGAEAEVYSLSDYQALQAQAVRTGALLRVMEPY